MLRMTHLLLTVLLGLWAASTVGQSADWMMTNELNRDDLGEKMTEVLAGQQEMFEWLERNWQRSPQRTASDAEVCPSPWEAFGGMCLIFNNKTLTWLDAEKFCATKGGHLTWIRNRIEHNAIRSFVLGNYVLGYFWIGLHRNSKKNGRLVWSNGDLGLYTGKPFTDTQSKIFSADSRKTQIDGDPSFLRLKSVCRLGKARREGQAILEMILEAKTVETRDCVMLSTAVTVAKITQQIGKQIKAAMLQKVASCPSPWWRGDSFCLLYIFQLRTWNDAQDMCTTLGGSLVWFEDKKEHEFIRRLRWAPQKRVYRWFWIGLHKESPGKLIWTGFSNSVYRGSPFTGSSSNFFGAERESLRIAGTKDSRKFSAVCRRLVS